MTDCIFSFSVINALSPPTLDLKPELPFLRTRSPNKLNQLADASQSVGLLTQSTCCFINFLHTLQYILAVLLPHHIQVLLAQVTAYDQHMLQILFNVLWVLLKCYSYLISFSYHLTIKVPVPCCPVNYIVICNISLKIASKKFFEKSSFEKQT